MEEVTKPNDKRAKAVILLLKIMMFMSVAWVVSHYIQYRALAPLVYSNNVSEDYFYLYVAYASPIKVAFRTIFLITIIVYLCWFYRAYSNLKIRRSQTLKYDELWSVLGWIVPPYFLIRPFEMMKELFDLTTGFVAMEIENYQPVNYKKTINYWWAFWLGAFVSWLSYVVMSELFYLPSSFEMNCIAGIVSAVLMIPAAFMAMKVVKAYLALETDLISANVSKTSVTPKARVATDEQSAPGGIAK